MAVHKLHNHCSKQQQKNRDKKYMNNLRKGLELILLHSLLVFMKDAKQKAMHLSGQLFC